MSTPHQQEFGTTYLQNKRRLLEGMSAVLRDHDAAEEVTATALAKGLTSLRTFRGDCNLYTWLYQIALREAWNYRKRCEVLSLDEIEGHEPPALADADPTEETLETSERSDRLKRALRRVPATNRRTLEDHFLRGYSVKQIAKRHGVPVGTVLSRIFSGKRLLRAAWEG